MAEELFSISGQTIAIAIVSVVVFIYLGLREVGFTKERAKLHALKAKEKIQDVADAECAKLESELEHIKLKNERLENEVEMLQLYSRQASHDGIDYLHAALAGLTNLADSIESGGAWEQKLVFARHDLMQVQHLLENLRWIFQLENKSAPSRKSLLDLRDCLINS